MLRTKPTAGAAPTHEVDAAIDAPGARDNDAEPIARINMRRAHVSRMPPDKDKVEARRSAAPVRGQTSALP